MRKKSLRLSLIDAFLSALMVGIGETYLPAYSLSIGMGEVFAGILASLPMISGAVLQLVTPRGLQRVQSHKHWVVAFSFLQALTFIPLVYFSATRAPNFWTLFFILTLYWGSGFSAGLAWNYWMGRLVNPEEGNWFFSKRTRISQIGILLGLIAGGIALHNKVELSPFSSVFTLLFLAAGGCRLMSALILSRQHFAPEWRGACNLGLRDSWKVFWKNQEKRRFFFYLVPFQAAVFVTSPFLTSYMLAQMKMNYSEYMIAIGMMFIGKSTILMAIEKFRGNIPGFSLFLFGAGAIVPLPILWVVNNTTLFIYGLQFISGLAWAFVEVGLALIFFKDIKHEEKVPILSVYNLLNSAAIILGTYVGGKVLWVLGEKLQAYHVVFILGTVTRFASVIPLYFYAKQQVQQPAITERLLPAPTTTPKTERAS